MKHIYKSIVYFPTKQFSNGKYLNSLDKKYITKKPRVFSPEVFLVNHLLFQ